MAEQQSIKTVVRNRKARHEYHVLETFEAGLVLQGTEVKSLRQGRANLQDSYARFDRGELWLLNLHISPYEQSGTHYNHEPTRPRKLLLHRREISRILGQVERQGFTLVPLEHYLKNGRVKVLLGLAKGKQEHDKRETIRKREVDRETRAAVKNKNANK